MWCFFRDPIQYAFNEANIMITATPTPANLRRWGGIFFSDQPSQYYTLNNGVVFYRSNAITNAFVLSLAADCVNSLLGHNDLQQGFLQIKFNQYMVRNMLVLRPCSKFSDPVTYQLLGSPVNNTIGECYDCYYGQVPVQFETGPTVSPIERHSRPIRVHPPKFNPTVPPAEHYPKLIIGVYPTKRYTSYCWKPAGYYSYCTIYLKYCHA